jgi:hypothetical protein
MRATRPLPVVLAAPLAAVSLLVAGLLAGCSDGGTPEPTATEPTGSASPEETAEPEDDADDGAPVASAGAGCVEGTWVSDPDAQAAQTTSGLGMADLGARATVTGESVTTFAGDSMTTEYRDLVVEVTWGLEGQAFRMVNSWSGTITGRLEVTDEHIVISDVDTSGLTLSYENYVNGELLEMPGIEEIPLSGMAAGGTSTYTCSGDELRMVPVVEGIDTSTMVTVLHRR